MLPSSAGSICQGARIRRLSLARVGCWTASRIASAPRSLNSKPLLQAATNRHSVWFCLACRTLNRIQSRIYATALGSNENILVCAPTGAGKTNIAMLAVLHEVGANMVDGMIQARCPTFELAPLPGQPWSCSWRRHLAAAFGSDPGRHGSAVGGRHAQALWPHLDAHSEILKGPVAPWITWHRDLQLTAVGLQGQPELCGAGSRLLHSHC